MSRSDFHDANRRRWNAAASSWSKKEDVQTLGEVAHLQPHLVLEDIELEVLGRLEGRSVCVLGSGDNLHAFALAGLGARVTSVDISEKQLEFAARRAERVGLPIEFVCADLCDLGPLEDASFDIVYTGGHVAVWVSDLERYYAEAARILALGGLLLVNEYHPFRRIWASGTGLYLERGYFERGPHAYRTSPGLFDRSHGDVESYEFNWTVADFYRAVVRAELRVIRFEEFGDQAQGWEDTDLSGLPLHLLIAAVK